MRKYRKSIRKRNKTKQRKTMRKRRMTTKRRTIRKRKTTQKQPKKHSTIQFESDYQNLRLRYLRAKKTHSKDEQNELSYLESLLKYLQKKQSI